MGSKRWGGGELVVKGGGELVWWTRFDCSLLPFQILSQMPQVHRRTFVFLVTFMKTLLDHSFANGLDAKFLGEPTSRT